MTEFNLPQAAFIRLDLFPASLTGPSLNGGIIERTRVIVTDSFVYAFVDGNAGPELRQSFELEEFTGSPLVGWTATVDDGDVIEIRRSSGCACGSRLRGIAPFPGVPYQPG
jgi:hypothetical protein